MARAPTQTISTLVQTMMMVRRSCRSAVSPATSARANSGRNCASPIMPSAKADCSTLWVRRATP